ncbi:hypothetical protein FQR65_LT12199 [Abscondita terminalis]|nr:hypothetical protein FQR65_LT12199 [Abscondita terminalis]
MKTIWNLLPNKPLCQYVASFCVTLITLCIGLHFGWTSPYMPFLLSEESSIRMTDEQASWVAVIYLIAGPCGTLTAPFLSNAFGRKPTLMCASVIFTISWLVLAFASRFSELLVVRFMAGANEGIIFSTTPVYLAEILHKNIRGLICSLLCVAAVTGILIMNILGSYLTIRDSSFVSLTIPITSLLIFIWMPESPNYFIMKGEKEKAKKCLIKLRPLTEVEAELEDIAKSVDDKPIKLLDFFLSKIYRKRLLVLTGLQAFQQLSGISAITIYAQTVFKETTDAISPLMAVAVLHSVEAIFSAISSLLIDKVGRRPLLIASTTIVAITLLVIGTYYYLTTEEYIDAKQIEWLPISCFVVFIIAYSFGLLTVPTFIAGEIFPTNLRSHAGAFANFSYFVIAFVASKFFQVTKDTYGKHVPFLTFGLFSILGLIFIIYFIPETKNKSLHEIQLELKRSNS